MTNISQPMGAGLNAVLISTDLSRTSDKPLRHALAVARHYSAKLYLTHVVSSLGYTIAGPEAHELACEATTREVRKLENDLVEKGSLTGLAYEFIVRKGEIWPELQSVIHDKHIDVIVVGTHGRRSLGKVLMGSVAEQIFRHSNVPVLTVGPGSAEISPIEERDTLRPFLFATDFGAASLNALPLAISFANHFGAKLLLLHVAPVAPIPEDFHWSRTTSDIRQLQENARQESLERLHKAVSANPSLTIEPEFLIKFGTPSKVILHVASTVGADLIVMGVNRSHLIDTSSHMPSTTAYEVVCGAGCSVLTVRSTGN